VKAMVKKRPKCKFCKKDAVTVLGGFPVCSLHIRRAKREYEYRE